MSVFSKIKRVLPLTMLWVNLLNVSTAAMANDIDPNRNKITSAAPEAVRCVPIPQPECLTKRQRALDKSCINQQEFDSLTRYNNVPICDYDEQPMDRLEAWCPCGCFEENTEILTVVKGNALPSWQKAVDLFKNRASSQVVALSDTSTLADFQLATRGILFSTIGDETQPLYVLTMANGVVLKLTRNHGVLRGDGAMMAAHELNVGDELVTSTGEKVAIVKVDRALTAAKVYNFLVDTDKNAEHTLVAAGFVVGDLAWQNNLANDIGSILLRQ